VGVLVRVGVGAAVVGATVGVGATVVDAALAVAVAVAVGVALGASVVGAAVRTWTVRLGVGEVEGLALGVGDAVVPARRAKPPPNTRAINRSVMRPPATAARTRSIQRGPRLGGGMIFVVSGDMSTDLSAPSVPTSARRSLVG
jgi:hypothetical protein